MSWKILGSHCGRRKVMNLRCNVQAIADTAFSPLCDNSVEGTLLCKQGNFI